MAGNMEAVQAIYEAFGRGDVPAILERLTEDVSWEEWNDNSAQTERVPWLVPRKGRDDVVGFFQTIGTWDFTRFEILSMMSSDDRVAAEVEVDAVLPNGTVIKDQEMHLWHFDEAGKVARFRHYVDTAKVIAAAQTL